MNLNIKTTINKHFSNISKTGNCNKTSETFSNSRNYNTNKSHRSKPQSMNDSMLREIMKEPLKKPTGVKTKSNSKLNLSTASKLGLNEKEWKNRIGSSTLKKPEHDPADYANTNTVITPADKLQISNSIRDRSSKAKSNIILNNKRCVITLGHEIPLPSNKYLQKNPSNGSTIEFFSNQSYTYTEREFFPTNFSNLNPNHSMSPLDSHKLTEELLDFKLANSKLKNEISILNEQIKTIKQVVTMKSDENEMIKASYKEMVDDYRKESEKARKSNSEFNSMKETINKHSLYITSIISVMTELIEMFISPRSPFALGNSYLMTRQSNTINNENISATDIDVYCSYKEDDDRRNTLIEQIQGLLVAKLNLIKRSLPNLDIEKEIERIKSWNFTKNPNESEINISNLRLSKNIIEESCSESFRKNCSNDFFDLSISNQIMSQSPKFNSAANSVYSVSAGGFTKDLIEKDRITINNDEKNAHNFLLNDSFLKDLKQSKKYLIVI